MRSVIERRFVKGVLTAVLWGFLLTAFLPALQAQDEELPTPQETAQLDRVGPWKVVNFVIFAVLLGWGIAKTAPRFFNARSADIQKAIKDATGLKLEADFRYSEIDRKMATLGEEVRRMREQGDIEMRREHEHMMGETQQELALLRRRLQTETEAFRAESRAKLRQGTAEQALALAEKRLADRGPAQDPGLLQDFIHLVERDNRNGSGRA